MTAPQGSDRILERAPLLPSAQEAQVMSMPASLPEITTIEHLLALPDDGLRHELLDGD